jgi:hypothetical protein
MKDHILGIVPANQAEIVVGVYPARLDQADMQLFVDCAANLTRKFSWNVDFVERHRDFLSAEVPGR